MQFLNNCFDSDIKKNYCVQVAVPELYIISLQKIVFT
jgi:hypothetical protein